MSEIATMTDGANLIGAGDGAQQYLTFLLAHDYY